MNEERRHSPSWHGGGNRAGPWSIYGRYGEDITKGANRVPVIISCVHEWRRRGSCGRGRRWENHAAARCAQLRHRRQIDAVLGKIKRIGDTDRPHSAGGGVADTDDSDADAGGCLRREVEAEDPGLLGRSGVDGLKELAITKYRLPTAVEQTGGTWESRRRCQL